MEKTKSKFYSVAIRCCVYILAFLIPIFFLPFTYEMVEYNKQMLLWLFAGIVFLLWIFQIAKEKKIIFKKSGVNLAILIFVGMNILVLAFSKNVHTSLWGCHGRYSDSFFGMVSLAVLSLAIINNGDIFFKEKKSQFLKVFFSATFISEIVLLLFSFGALNKISALSKLSGGNTMASFKEGAAAFLALILCMEVFNICKKCDLSFKNNIFNYIFLVTTLTALLTLDCKPIWAFLAIVMLVLAGFFVKGFKKVGVLLPTAVAVISLLCAFSIFQAKNISFLGNMNKISPEVKLSPKQSLDIAKRTLKGNPMLAILGSGQGNFSYNFSKLKPASFNETSLWRFKFNKTNSYILELFATTGIIGVLAWIVLMGSFAYAVAFKDKFKVFKSHENFNECAVLAFGLLVALFLQFFYNSTTLLLFSVWMFATFAVAGYQKGVKNKEIKFKKFAGIFNVAVVGMVIFFGFAIFKISGCYGASFYYRKAVLEPAGVYEQEEAKKEAIKLDGKNYSYYVDLAQVYVNMIAEESEKAFLNDPEAFDSEESLDLTRDLFEKAVASAGKAVEMAPNDVRTWEIMAYIESNRAGDFKKAKEMFEKATELDPNNPIFKMELGAIFFAEDNLADAMKTFQEVLAIKKDFQDAYYGMALCYEKQEDNQKALENYQKLLELDPDNEKLKEKIYNLQLAI